MPTSDTQYSSEQILYGMRGHLSQRLANLSRRALLMDAPTIQAMGECLDAFREDRRVAREARGATTTPPPAAGTPALSSTPGPGSPRPPADPAPGAAAHRALVAERAEVAKWKHLARQHEGRSKAKSTRITELEAEVARLSESR